MIDVMHIVGDHDENTIEQLRGVALRAERTALMSDGHLGYWMPIGGVAAFKDWVTPAGVGYDIACGNCAIKTDMKFADLGDTDDKRHRILTKLADDIQSHISFGVGRSNLATDAPTDHSLFTDVRWDALPAAAPKDQLRDMARNQLGTIGSGNHYVDVFTDEDGIIWVGVHFGSRGFGHKICSGFMSLAAGAYWSGTTATKDSNPGALIRSDSWTGEAYWAMMELAGDYAYAGREWVTRKVVELLGADEMQMIHNHHNFAWKEEHVSPYTGEMEEFIVVRKGATPAFPGQKGFVGGSMGDTSVILQGKRQPPDTGGAIDVNFDGELYNLQTAMMFSTVHGAGRVLGRAAAKKGQAILDDRGTPTGERDTSTMVTQDMMDEWVKKAGIHLRGGGVDESPHVYRRLPEVLEAQGDTIEVLHTLTPLVVVMAGKNEWGPKKGLKK